MATPSVDQIPDPSFPVEVWDGTSRSRSVIGYKRPDADDYTKLLVEIQRIETFLLPRLLTDPAPTANTHVTVSSGLVSIGVSGLAFNLYTNLHLAITGTITSLIISAVPATQVLPVDYALTQLTTHCNITIDKNGTPDSYPATISYDPATNTFTLTVTIAGANTDTMIIDDNISFNLPAVAA